MNCSLLLFLLAVQCYILSFTLIHASSEQSESKDDAKIIWENHGGGIQNTRHRHDRMIQAAKLGSKTQTMNLQWIFRTNSTAANPSISATPAIGDGKVYFPSFDGYMYAVRQSDGQLVWKRRISNITGKASDFSRATPLLINLPSAISRGKSRIYDGIIRRLLVDGSQGISDGLGAVLYALDRDTGTTVWKTKLHPHPAAIITQSGSYYDGYIYVGVSSQEEGFALTPGYDCCTFVGSMNKVDARTGRIIWSTPMIQPNLVTGVNGYSGNAVWGSSPSIDVKRNRIYIATGNNYNLPPAIEECFQNATTTISSSAPCMEKGNYFDAILALSMKDGSVIWNTEVQGYDAFTDACFFGEANCPSVPGPDWDFGAAPMLLVSNRGEDDRLIIGQKSGIVYSLDPKNGKVQWATAAGPGGTLGGHNWGASADGVMSYFGQINTNYAKFVMVDGTIIYRGAWVALNNSNGQVIWSTPTDQTFAGPCELNAQLTNVCSDFAAGPTMVVNDVLFVGQTNVNGTVFALNVHDGSVLWRYPTGGMVYGGFAADGEGCVYVGSGYALYGQGQTNDKLFAFCAAPT